MAPRLDDSGKPSYDRRQSDRLLAAVEQSLLERMAALAERQTSLERALGDRMALLERDGSRGHAVLVERVLAGERRREDLLKANDESHRLISEALKDVETRLDRVDQVVIKANLDRLPERVDRLEEGSERRSGLTAGVKTAVGVYAAVGVAFAGLVLQVALK